ncbi:hypothetical protein [Halosolutus gelatinilyticus]|uniref:DUF7847 domain-containing protein n=1 Tax=Halosolutus gelatinilyticus TaxID=2931975 RepID=UPI001FF132BA|nr:hypothetical protein [Halosolutus gelatinilyticus]
MSAIRDLSTAWAAFRSNPVILVGALFLVGLGEVSVVVNAYVSSVIAAVLWLPWIFVFPFPLGGLLTMANEALAGSTDLGAFVRGGKASYVSLLAATIVFAVIVISVSFAGVIAAAVVGVGTVAASGSVGAAVIVVFGLVGLLVGLVVLFLQFYDAAIVVSGVGAIDSLSRSAALVRRNFVSAVGFSLVSLAISAIGQGPGMALYLTATETTEAGAIVVTSGSRFALSVGLTLVLGTIASGLTYTYLVAYYRSLVATEPAAVAGV